MTPSIRGVLGWWLVAALLGGCGDGKGGDSSGPVSGAASGSTGGLPSGATTPCGYLRTSPFSVWTDWVDDGGTPATGSCGDQLQVQIIDPLGVIDWQFGMAESGGWTGEDCFNGSGTMAVCHPVTVFGSTLNEVADCQPSSVVAGSTTLMDASKEPFLTYYLADANTCFVWGADASYYAALGCFELC